MLKLKIINAPILVLLNLQQPSEIDIDASEYDMGVVLMKGRKPIYYHYEKFSRMVLNYPKYDKELYALVQTVKKWKYYLMGKEVNIHTNH